MSERIQNCKSGELDPVLVLQLVAITFSKSLSPLGTHILICKMVRSNTIYHQCHSFTSNLGACCVPHPLLGARNITEIMDKNHIVKESSFLASLITD